MRFVLFVFVLLLFACKHEPVETTVEETPVTVSPDDTPTVNFSTQVLPLFVKNCNFRACHGNGSKAGNVELSNYANTMEAVVAYKPEQSLVYISLIKTDPLRRMPPAGPLHQPQVDLVRKWIAQGAKNN